MKAQQLKKIKIHGSIYKLLKKTVNSPNKRKLTVKNIENEMYCCTLRG